MSNELQGRRATDGGIQRPETNETHKWISVTSPNSSLRQHAFCTPGQGNSQLYICRYSGQLNGQCRTFIKPLPLPIPTNNGNLLTDCEILIDPHGEAEWTKLTEPFDPLSKSYNPVNASRSKNETGIYIGKVTDKNGWHHGLGTIFNEGGVFKLSCGKEPHMLNSVPDKVNGFSYHVLCQKKD